MIQKTTIQTPEVPTHILRILEVTHLSLHLPIPCVLTSYGRSSGAVLFRQEGVHWLEMLTLTLLNVFLEAWSRE